MVTPCLVSSASAASSRASAAASRATSVAALRTTVRCASFHASHVARRTAKTITSANAPQRVTYFWPMAAMRVAASVDGAASWPSSVPAEKRRLRVGGSHRQGNRTECGKRIDDEEIRHDTHAQSGHLGGRVYRTLHRRHDAIAERRDGEDDHAGAVCLRGHELAQRRVVGKRLLLARLRGKPWQRVDAECG